MRPLEEERPCLTDFEWRAVENRNKTMEAGRAVYENVAYVKVRPSGQNLELDFPAEEWLKNNLNDRFARHYQACFDAWKKNEEMPVEGTRIEDWPSITPADVKMIKGANLLTIEDLAVCNDEALKRIGMGAVALRERARAYLQTAKDKGATSEELAKLRADLETVKSQLEEANKKIEVYEADRPKRGRPRKT